MAQQEQLVKKSLERSFLGPAVTARAGHRPVVQQDAESKQEMQDAQYGKPDDTKDRDSERD